MLINRNSSKTVYSVRQVNQYIKRVFDEDFTLKNINIRGEISNCKYHYSGHIYFSLKDESGVLSCVMFASDAAGLRMRLEDGREIIACGNITVYVRDGKYQLYVKHVEETGQGDLYQQFEKLKQTLAETGMFDSMYKKPIPPYSMNIGVVTAETGAVIRDIYNVASRRNPYCQIKLYPAAVQGAAAAPSICAGIRKLDQMGLDVIIIGRGGGSIEDLWAFNEESVARAIFEAQTPIISAVGHETDFTIADFAADLRAPTPSAAAELAVFDYSRFLQDLDHFRHLMENGMQQKLTHYQQRLRQYSLQIELGSPQGKLERRIHTLQEYQNILNERMNLSISKARERLVALSERLNGLSPLKRLSEGYAYVTDRDGKSLRSVDQTQPSDLITVHVADGILQAEVKEKKKLIYE